MFCSLSLQSPHKDSYFMIKSHKLPIPVPLFIVKKITTTQNKYMSIPDRIILQQNTFSSHFREIIKTKILRERKNSISNSLSHIISNFLFQLVLPNKNSSGTSNLILFHPIVFLTVCLTWQLHSPLIIAISVYLILNNFHLTFNLTI